MMKEWRSDFFSSYNAEMAEGGNSYGNCMGNLHRG